MKKEYHIQNWSVVSYSYYIAPECNLLCLQGFRKEDQRLVKTSPIVSANNKVVKTESGSTYYLEEIDPEYVSFLLRIGVNYNPDNPLEIKDYKKE